ncbi:MULTISPECIES: type IX secretion system membrane protein PorP/SprF [unclassified Flavobacterium]|uniref:PorP/SprF family type IX secretion system membrane protein n=1 Tax=unclassified Flavobacterium TaxID=196869 RepID=UPI001F13CBC4|nr:MULTISPECIES: type IX secretion system membrane protein PorP/SprF [unclassified Flavobacterium]UMY66727.1 type IX secretion system membrane protein PorP/SprF [Flavobacterium sp. HJ-32-4]
MNFRKRYLVGLFSIFFTQLSFSQEGIAVYSDYLSDNYYLIHPSMAGAANCAKLRLTARQQWFGQEDAPALQTASFNGRLGEQSGGGIILFNDRNGYHSQRGFKLTYAHHLMFSRSEVDLNQLSFGISAGIVQSQLDETDFTDPDPIIGGIVQKDSYFNVDIGASYFYLDLYTHLTVKNALGNRPDYYTDYESDNRRKWIWSAGYVFGDTDRIQWEPSFMFQYVDQTKEKTIDLNVKAYKDLEFGKLWGGLSYRRAFDAAEYSDSQGNVKTQRLQWLTPIVGLNFRQYMVSYTYSHIMGDVKFDQGGFHQITLGMNLFCKREKYDCNCPAIN